MLKLIFSALLAVLGMQTPTPKTWYVRVDGALTADGLADAPCAPRVTHCAFSTPALLALKMKPGDTVVIHAGQYRCGYLGPNVNDDGGLSEHGNPYAPCFSVPANTTWVGDGSSKTQIFGGYGAGTVFDLKNSPGVTIKGIEVTDHGSCSKYGADPIPCNTSYPLSDFADNGIWTGTGTCGLTLEDVNIHGFTKNGIVGPICGTVTATNVRIAANGAAGWNFDDGARTPTVSGSVVASHLTVEWNGCNEEYPITHQYPLRSCYDDNNGGYGDGIGTPDTPLNFACDHCTFRYNTQDGFDLLHTSGSEISITHSTSYGNEGQQWKMGAMKKVVFQNNVTVHSCSRMSQPIGDWPGSTGLSDFCRAAGDGITFAVMDGGTYTFQNNSFAGYGETSYDIECGRNVTCTQPNITFQNNLHIGYVSPRAGQTPGVFYMNGVPANPFVAADHNIYFNMRTCPTEKGSSCADPKIAVEPTFTSEAALDAIDFHLTPASTNAIGAGAAVGLTDDYDGVARLNPTSIGAYESTAPAAPPPHNHAVTHPRNASMTSAPRAVSEGRDPRGMAGMGAWSICRPRPAMATLSRVVLA